MLEALWCVLQAVSAALVALLSVAVILLACGDAGRRDGGGYRFRNL